MPRQEIAQKGAANLGNGGFPAVRAVKFSSCFNLFCFGCKFKVMLESANIVFRNLESTRYIIKHSVGNTAWEKLCILFVNEDRPLIQ